MTDTQNISPVPTQLAYENTFSPAVNTNALYFASAHPFTEGSKGDNLYQVAVQQNGHWITEPVYVRWEDNDKQLVAGLHSTGPVTGVRLYHVGSNTSFRKPTLFNVNAGILVHSPEVAIAQKPEWQNVAIQNPGFENRGFVNEGGQDSSFTGWKINAHYPSGNIHDNHHGKVAISGTAILEQSLTETFETTAQYRLSVEAENMRIAPYNPADEHLQLWAGNTLLGDMKLPITNDNKEYTLCVDGTKSPSATGQSLRIKIVPSDSNTEPAGIYLDNFHLQKLVQTIASFAAPDGISNGPVARTLNKDVFPELTTVVVP